MIFLMKHAFSLVELSIVLVILGLLTGGILAGQSLIRASELRSVSADAARYKAAAMTFRDKYFAVPGEMTNATKFWGQSTVCSGASANGTCDGNANGMLEYAAGVSQTGEIYQFWRQLALAGLIEGTYTGVAGTGTGYHDVIGSNVPRSRVGTAGFSVHYSDLSGASHPFYFSTNNGNYLLFGAAQLSGYTDSSAIKPEEAWNIDTKMDDGKPGSGAVYGPPFDSCGNGANSYAFTTDYYLANNAVACFMVFARQF